MSNNFFCSSAHPSTHALKFTISSPIIMLKKNEDSDNVRLYLCYTIIIIITHPIIPPFIFPVAGAIKNLHFDLHFYTFRLLLLPSHQIEHEIWCDIWQQPTTRWWYLVCIISEVTKIESHSLTHSSYRHHHRKE